MAALSSVEGAERLNSSRADWVIDEAFDPKSGIVVDSSQIFLRASSI